ASAEIGATTSTGDSGCWIWVDDDWQPSLQMTVGGGVVMVDGVAQANPMVAKRSTPFNRKISDGSSADYPAPQRVSLDYAALCPGTKAQFVDTEAIRLGHQLFMGDAGRYTFDNRSVLEKRPVQQLPVASTTSHTREDSTRTPPAPESTAKGFRWSKRNGDWMDYDAQGQGVAFGDRNGNTIWLQRDDQGRLLSTVDDSGHTLLSFHYTGELLTEVKDYPLATVAGDLPSRSIKYQYDEKNRLTQTTDPRGNTIQYAYDAANRLIRITDQEGRTERIVYEGDTIKQRIAPDGGVTDYEFDYDDVNKQFVSKITGPETAAGRRVQNYTHNRQGQLVRYTVNGRTETEIRYDTGYRAETRTNARGFATKTTKNEFEQIVETQYPDGSTQKMAYSALHMGMTEETDELGVKTKYEYDAKGNLLKTVQAAGTAEERTTEYQVNAQGQTTRITYKGRTESNGSVTPDALLQIAYDSLGNISQTIDPEGSVRRYGYDRTGNLLSYTDPLGNTTQYDVDAAGNLLKETNPLGHSRSYAYDKVGNLISKTDARGKTTLMAYDTMNRYKTRTNPRGGVHQTQHNAQGLMTTEIDEDGRQIQLEYDNFQRVTKQFDALGNIVRFSYQISDGSTTGQLGSLGEPTQIDYPGLSQINRFDERERPTSQSLKYRNAQGEKISANNASYDKRGQVLSETDGDGNIRTHRYNAFGKCIETIDALGGKTTYRFDARGNLSEIVDAKGNTHNFEYDRNDRVTKEVRPLGQIIQYKYDAAGNIIQKIEPNGNLYLYTLDAASRITKIIQKSANETQLRTVNQTWDANDNLMAWRDANHVRNQVSSATITYDDDNHKIGETITYPSGNSLAYNYTYSLAGKKTSLTWPDGTKIDYSYSDHGELQSITIPGEGNISVTEYVWTERKTTTLPGGGTQNKTFDGLLNLETFTVKTPGQKSTLDLSNTYGSLQELKSRSRIDTANNQGSTQSEQYSYDAEARLTKIRADTGGLFAINTKTFTLDAVANRIAQSNTSGTWQYDANNRLIQIGSGTCGSAGTTCYQWDDNGNRTKKIEAGHRITHYWYDSQNRLEEITQSINDEMQQLIARYGYDPMDRRIWKEQFHNQTGQALDQAQKTYYLYADEGLIAEATQPIVLNADKSVTATADSVITTQYGPYPDSQWGTGVLFIKTKDSRSESNIAYYHHDHLNTPIQATDKLGNVVWIANYDAFGKATITTPSATNNPTISSNLRLPGQYEDQETGLHYNFKRYYDPETGTYLTSDPVGVDGGLNLYLYSLANPINVTDSTGEMPHIILIPVSFCVRFPRVCAAIFHCIRNPDKCRKVFCKVIHPIYKKACTFPGCKESRAGDGPASFELRLSMASACIAGRQIARTICRGTDKTPSGENHEKELEKAVDKWKICFEKLRNCLMQE
ncbi:hypothetical protein D8B23_19750, partial [Verminephrobacter aporrectodeae subsp. tuberculatae]|nr:hypothetical protein [Verminephrobacter aporrectodeae subsp. tuberculatae]